ncbi:MAG: FAD-dependent oxidoreductase [Betaproteobacteria bacterium]
MPDRAKIRPWLATAALAAVVLWLWMSFAPAPLLTLEQLKSTRALLEAEVGAQPVRAGAIFFAGYLAVAALSIPGAAVLTLAGGALFGFGWGLVLVSFASSLGGLLAFLASRYLLRDVLRKRFGGLLAPIDEAVRRDGTTYLLALRLLPVFPFWLINLLMGLTPMTAARFYAVSQLGMLAGTAVYVNAGTQLAAIDSPDEVMSPALLGSLAVLAAFPFLAGTTLRWFQAKRVYARWRRPLAFDRNLVVIGAGAGGLVSSYLAAAVKARVTLIEAHRMGGDCLNAGCVPSKALIRAASLAHQMRRAHDFGLGNTNTRIDFEAVLQRVRSVICSIEPHDSSERYAALGVEVLHGHAQIKDPWRVEVRLADGNTQTLTTRNIILATGASPSIPNLPGLHEAGFLTSETVWNLRELPRRLVVLGGGPVGCELAQSFARLGSEVTLLESAERILMREDPEVAALVATALEADGVRVLSRHQALRVEVADGRKWLLANGAAAQFEIAFDALLCAVGRSARVSGYGLEALGIALTTRGTIATNAFMQTNYPNILAVGDVAGPFQFTHTAAHQAWYGVINALFGRFWKFKADYRVVPRATFTDPEVARVGLNETEAIAQGVAFELTRFPLAELDRAIIDGAAPGSVKVLSVPGRDRILGVTIVGGHAAEMLAEFVLAMRSGLGLNQILGTIHTYPTWSEANKYAAGAWRRAHAPKSLLALAARYHAWERA